VSEDDCALRAWMGGSTAAKIVRGGVEIACVLSPYLQCVQPQVQPQVRVGSSAVHDLSTVARAVIVLRADARAAPAGRTRRIVIVRFVLKLGPYSDGRTSDINDTWRLARPDTPPPVERGFGIPVLV
jgi:hypothetical protein